MSRLSRQPFKDALGMQSDLSVLEMFTREEKRLDWLWMQSDLGIKGGVFS